MAYCHSGYKPGARKQALVQHVPERTFSLHDAATGQTVYQGKASPLNQDKKQDKGFLVLDFSSFNTPGQYFLSIGDVQSKPFPIGNDAYLSTAWHTLNFFFPNVAVSTSPAFIRNAIRMYSPIIPTDGA